MFASFHATRTRRTFRMDLADQQSPVPRRLHHVFAKFGPNSVRNSRKTVRYFAKTVRKQCKMNSAKCKIGWDGRFTMQNPHAAFFISQSESCILHFALCVHLLRAGFCNQESTNGPICGLLVFRQVWSARINALRRFSGVTIASTRPRAAACLASSSLS